MQRGGDITTQKARSGAAVPCGEPRPDRAQGAGFAGRQISARVFDGDVVRGFIEILAALKGWPLPAKLGGEGVAASSGLVGSHTISHIVGRHLHDVRTALLRQR